MVYQVDGGGQSGYVKMSGGGVAGFPGKVTATGAKSLSTTAYNAGD